MELNERETLVKVEQQLKNSIENQAQITEDMREIFGRIDRESKILAAVKGDLQTHLETSNVQRESCNDRIESSQRRVEYARSKIEEMQEKHNLAVKDLKEAIEKEEDAREKLERELAVFMESVKTSVRNFKLLVAIIGTFFGVFTPYVTLLIKEILGK